MYIKNRGIGISKEPMEVCSGPHTFLGGIRIDEFGRTNIPGLYAGGEAGGGIHGSNRLSGAALADSFVFGSRSGNNAANIDFFPGQLIGPGGRPLLR